MIRKALMTVALIFVAIGLKAQSISHIETTKKFLIIIDVALANTFEGSCEMFSKFFRKMITVYLIS